MNQQCLKIVNNFIRAKLDLSTAKMDQCLRVSPLFDSPLLGGAIK